MEELLSRVVLLLTVAALTTTTYSAEEYSIEGVVFAVSSAVGPRTVYIVSSIYELTTSSTTIEKRATTWLLLTTYNIHSTRGEKEEEEEASWNGGRHRRTPLTTTQVSAAAAAVLCVVCAVYIALESHAAAADGGRCLFRCSPFDALEKTKFALVCTSSSSIVVEVLQTHRPPLARLLHPSSRYLVCVVTKLHPMFLLCYSTNMLCHAIAQ